MNLVRNLVRCGLRRFGYDIRRYVSPVGGTIPLLSLAIRSFLHETPDFFFVQVGANDGIIDDPIQALVRRYRLRGLLLEPIPKFFQELKSNYADQPQLLFENCALWSEDGTQQFFRIRHEAYPNPRIKGMAGLSRKKLMAASSYLPRLSENIESFLVPTTTATALLHRHRISKVDLLLVDTEGMDDAMIYLFFATGQRPSLVFFEHIHMSVSQQDACFRYLMDLEYQFARTRTDTLAIRHGAPFV